MLIKRIGEFGLINRIKRAIHTDSSVVKGIGDDCAVIKFSKNKYLLLSADMLVEDVDFRRSDDPYLIGRKALAVSLSDIAACGGIARYALVSLGLPPNSSLEFTDKLYCGITDLARKYKVNIVGGDISRAKKLTLDISVLGMVEKGRLVLRSGAKTGDILFVTGSLGASICGKHLKFEPRLKEARFLTGNFKVNSMIDISDGLTLDLGHILEESNAGAIIYEQLVPLSKEAHNLSEALYDGEDFELLFSLSPKQARRLIKLNKTCFRPIGEIADKKCGLTLVSKNGRQRLIKPKGFRHF